MYSKFSNFHFNLIAHLHACMHILHMCFFFEKLKFTFLIFMFLIRRRTERHADRPSGVYIKLTSNNSNIYDKLISNIIVL